MLACLLQQKGVTVISWCSKPPPPLWPLRLILQPNILFIARAHTICNASFRHPKPLQLDGRARELTKISTLRKLTHYCQEFGNRTWAKYEADYARIMARRASKKQRISYARFLKDLPCLAIILWLVLLFVEDCYNRGSDCSLETKRELALRLAGAHPIPGISSSCGLDGACSLETAFSPALDERIDGCPMAAYVYVISIYHTSTGIGSTNACFKAKGERPACDNLHSGNMIFTITVDLYGTSLRGALYMPVTAAGTTLGTRCSVRHDCWPVLRC